MVGLKAAWLDALLVAWKVGMTVLKLETKWVILKELRLAAWMVALLGPMKVN